MLDRVTPWAASLVTSLHAGIASADITPLPGWADAGIMGAVVLALGYTVRHLFGRWDEARNRHMEFLEQELQRTREELRKARDSQDE